MGKQIKQSDISEADVFGAIGASAEKNIQKVEALNLELIKVSKVLNETLKTTEKNSEKNINAFVAQSKALNDVASKVVQNNKTISDSEKLRQKALEEKWKAEQSLQRQREKSIAQMEKEAKRTAEAERPYNKLSARLNELRKNYKDLAVAGNENSASARKMKAEIDSLDKTLKRVDGNVGQFQRNVGNYSSAFGKMQEALGSLGLTLGAGALFGSLVNTEIQLVRMRSALKNVTTSQNEYAQSLAFLDSLSKNYGQDLSVLTNTYTNFIASAKSSQLPLEEQQKIYQSVVKASGALGLSNEQLEGSLLAVSQMFSKGKVSAEELRGQLGERLPGAFGLMAKALNVSEGELNDMLQKGEVLAKDALPLLASELEKTYGAKAQENLKTVGGAFNVIKTEFSNFVSEANKGGRITEFLADVFLAFGRNLSTIIPMLGKLIGAFVLYKTSIIAVNTYTAIANTNFKDLVKGMFSAEQGATKFGQALKGIGFSVAITLLFEVGKAIYDFASGAMEAEYRMNELNKAIQEGTETLDKYLTKLDEYKRLQALNIKEDLKNGKITQKQADERVKSINKIIQEELRAKRIRLNSMKEEQKAEIERLKLEREGLNQFLDAEQYALITKEIIIREGAVKKLNTVLIGLAKEQKELNFEIREEAVNTENSTKAKDKSIKATKEKTEALKWENKELERNIELNTELLDKAREQSENAEDSIKQRRINSARIKVLEAELNGDLDEIDKARIEEIRENLAIELESVENNEVAKYRLILEAEQDIRDIQDKQLEREKEFNKKLRDFSRQTADEIIQQLKRVSEERESEFDRRIQAEQDLQDKLAEQANAGNIQAQQSLIASQQAEQKATIAKQKEQQKQQRLDEINLLMKAIQQNVDNGDSIPIALGKAGSQVGLVKAFVKIFGNIKGFFEGTEGTLADESTPLKSGKDGHLIWADGNEKIMKGDYVKKLANVGLTKTSDIVSSAIMYQNIATKGTQVGYSIDLGSVVNKLDELQKTIKNKPETTISPLIIEGMAKGVVETHKQGNITRLNKYLS